MPKNVTKAAEDQTAALANEAEGANVGETKLAAFERIATRRVGNVLAGIRLLEGLTNKANYDYTDEHWSEIFGAISAQMNKLADRYAGKTEAKTGFGFAKTAAPVAEETEAPTAEVEPEPEVEQVEG